LRKNGDLSSDEGVWFLNSGVCGIFDLTEMY